MDSVEERANRIFEGMSTEEFVHLLEEAGFEVTEGTGRVIDGNGVDVTDQVIR